MAAPFGSAAEPAGAGGFGELGELGDEALYREAATDLMVASSSSPEDSAHAAHDDSDSSNLSEDSAHSSTSATIEEGPLNSLWRCCSRGC